MNSISLLHIDASPRGERSRSRKLGIQYVTAWKHSHPGANVDGLDLDREPPPFVSEDWVVGAFAPIDQQTPLALKAIATSNRYVDQLLAATDILITMPMYNLAVPAVFKAWIDQVVRAGRTFGAGANGFVGLATGKRARVIVASGSDFRPGTAAAGYDFVTPYLRAILGFIGITDVEFIYAHSQNQGNAAGPQALADADATIGKLAAA
jgi:FMN-dependent NADH-azoreductase